MQKTLFIIFFCALSVSVCAQKICCPIFQLKAALEPCDTARTPYNGPGNGTPLPEPQKCDMNACKNGTETYFVYPLKAGFTYNWHVVGGTATSLTGDPVAIIWGGGSTAKIIVYISNEDGTCKDTLKRNVCLINSPKAAFTFSPTTAICANGTVQFTSTSIGAGTYYWDFGDGTSSTLANPSHTFTTGGSFNVILRLSSLVNGGYYNGQKFDCGCKDTAAHIITVNRESGLTILPGCKKIICAGDTTSYCSGSSCGSYNWSVTGGHIIGGNKAGCINVVWDGVYPATVSLSANCGGACGNSATINVPVLYATMPIIGKNIVCPSSIANYSLPAMPGTLYSWTVSGGGTIIGADKNTSDISIQWGATVGAYTVTCNYQNPISHCSGKGTIVVKVLPPYTITGLQKFCVGNTFNFTANGPGNWSFNPNAGFTPSSFPTGTSINGTWNNAGAYLLTATPTTPTNYCSSPATLNIIVLDTPKLNAIKGEVNICPGTNQIYSISSNMDEPRFIWNVVGGTVTANMGNNIDSIVVKWNNAGPYSVSVSQTVNGCSSSPKTFTPVAYPAPQFTGFSTACMDKEFIYTSTTLAAPGGYAWSLNNANATIVNGQGTNTIKIMWHGSSTPGIATSVVTLTTCGGTFSETVTIETPPPVTITATNSLCNPTGETLTSGLAGSSYQWFFNDAAMAASNNTQSIHVSFAGIYAVVVTSANGCTSKGSIYVAQPAFPKATISTPDKVWWKCTETISTTFTALPNGAGYCYQWFQNGGTVGGNSSNYTATAIGKYWCVVSLCNTSCSSNSDTVNIVKESCDVIPSGTCNPNYTFAITHNSCNPFTFNLTASPPVAATWAHWYFGDGSMVNEGFGLNVSHRYEHIGHFNVCAIFGDSPYCRKDTCFTINVPLVARFASQINCHTVVINNLSESITPTYTATWSFPNGTPSSSNLLNPSNITYNTAGTFPITLTISNGICTETYTDSVKINFPTATSSIPTPICALTEAPFTGSGNGLNLTYHWNFGDGFTSDLISVFHAYQLAGNYTVTFTVTDKNGCTATDTKTIAVLAPITVSIGADQFVCPGGSTVLSAPTSFTSYQWFKNGVAITGATSANFSATTMGQYWVQLANGIGCVSISNKIFLYYRSAPMAKIIKNPILCKSNSPLIFTMQNYTQEAGCTYNWICANAVFSPNNTVSASITHATVSNTGDYQMVLEVTSSFGCVSRDTFCVTVVDAVKASVVSPAGSLCEGSLHTFIASALPNLTMPNQYFYQWGNGMVGNTMSTGMAGGNIVTVTNNSGCTAQAFSQAILPRPNLSLFPTGCDTTCVTDTVFIPLPISSNNVYPYTLANYVVTWYDSGTPVGTGFNLPLANIQPGDHHLSAVVQWNSGCNDTTGTFDLYVKDCSLLPPCNYCPTILKSSLLATTATASLNGNAQFVNGQLEITTLKPLKEVRFSIADLTYHWNDTACNNCKITLLERGCLFPANSNQPLGTLAYSNYSNSAIPPNSNANKCPGELVFTPGSILPAGTYSIPFQLSLPTAKTNSCKLIIDKFCANIALVDADCNICESTVCQVANDPNANCDCNISNNWNSLYLVPTKPGIQKPNVQIICGNILEGYHSQTMYLLSGVYHCKTNSCLSVNNSVVVTNSNNDIVYTHVGAMLYETFQFPTDGLYTVKLTAHCGNKVCECIFKINVTPAMVEPPKLPVPPVVNTVPTKTPTPATIDSLLAGILPKDFSGGILVAKNDTAIYEKYIGKQNGVNSHTAFDLASVAKTFTGMAILKMAENKQLDLNDDVKKYLPNFPFAGITIKMLLSHRSGLEDYVKFMETSDWDKKQLMTNADLLQYIIANPTKVKIAEPGKAFNYSNTNFAMLALVIEKVNVSSYKQYITNTFLKPLQMNDSYVFGKDDIGKATKSYYSNGRTYDFKYLDLIYGDKNIYSTVGDMMKWDAALRSTKIFTKATLELAFSPTNKLEPYKSNYGLGWRMLLVPNGKKLIYHNGWWHGNRSVFIRMVDEKAVIIILSNSSFTTISQAKKLADLFGEYQQTTKNFENF